MGGYVVGGYVVGGYVVGGYVVGGYVVGGYVVGGYVVGVDIGRRAIRIAVADLEGSIVARLDEPDRCRSAGALVRTVRESCCAVGEHALGAALGVAVPACLTVGTGIGMGVPVDGRLFRGAHGAAGEIADLPFGPRPDRRRPVVPPGAGARRPGPVETAAAGRAVVAAARSAGLAKARSAKDVFRLARTGDSRALAVVEQEAEKLAYVVAAVTAVLDPRLIVLGGGIGGNTDLLAGPMRRALAATTPVVPEIVAGRLGEDAVLAGAIATALDTACELVFDRRGLSRAAGDA